MNKPLHPLGLYSLRLIEIKNNPKNAFEPIGVFEGVDGRECFKTIIRVLSLNPRWYTATKDFFDELEGFNPNNKRLQELSKFTGQVFYADIGPGNEKQRNIKSFKPLLANINSISPSTDPLLPGKLCD